MFEPGSVGKIITIAAAVDKNQITPEHGDRRADDPADRRRDDPRRVVAPGAAVHRDRGAGRVVERRHAEDRAEGRPDDWFKYAQAFGVGQATGIELPGESAGYIPPLDEWSDSTFANLPFGQGESMTVLQLASMYQAVANNGVRVAAAHRRVGDQSERRRRR